MPAIPIDPGTRFGRLVVLRPGKPKEKGRGTSVCMCDCGTEWQVRNASLRRGATNSCGCFHHESVVANGKITKHGMRRSPEYRIWCGMRQRCHNPRSGCYAGYGARGIVLCKEWRDSFEAFYAHIGPRPSPSHQVDRINTLGNYEPGNVRWATCKENNNNRKDNRVIELNGEKRTAAQWAELYGISGHAILRRLKYGWSPSQAITRPIRHTRKGR